MGTVISLLPLRPWHITGRPLPLQIIIDNIEIFVLCNMLFMVRCIRRHLALRCITLRCF